MKNLFCTSILIIGTAGGMLPTIKATAFPKTANRDSRVLVADQPLPTNGSEVPDLSAGLDQPLPTNGSEVPDVVG